MIFMHFLIKEKSDTNLELFLVTLEIDQDTKPNVHSFSSVLHAQRYCSSAIIYSLFQRSQRVRNGFGFEFYG